MHVTRFAINWLLMARAWHRSSGWRGVWFCARHIRHTWRGHVEADRLETVMFERW
jgi:hypothetical protein